MINCKCVICNKDFIINCEESKISQIEGCTLDCPECKSTLIIEDGTYKDLNEVLKKRYKAMGVDVDDKIDYTKFFIEF